MNDIITAADGMAKGKKATVEAEVEVEVDATEAAPIEYEKGSWQDSLQKSGNLFDRSAKNKKTASALLWKGAKEGIESWLPDSATDVSAEGLYNDVIEALGRSRKGDASKIKTVAVAVRSGALDLSVHNNLSKAYAAARALTVTAEQHANEDTAAEKAVENIEAPKTTGSVEGAALLLLSKGVDGAVVAILDALGKSNFDAHRAFARAISTEIADRVQAAKPKPTPKPAAPKGATPAKKTAAKKAAPIAPKKKGRPVAAPASTDETPAEDNVVNIPVAKKGRPVVKRPGK